MEFERLACIIKFARLKRGLTQEQVAKKVGITTSYVTSLENSIRTSKNTAKVILHSLGVHLAVIDDPGIYQFIQRIIDTRGVFAVCCIIDAYCYSLPPSAVKKIIGIEREYVTSLEMFKLLEKIDKKRLEKILLAPVDELLPFITTSSEMQQKRLNSRIVEKCLKHDPFYLILNELNISVCDCFDFFELIENKLSKIRFLPASVLEQKRDLILKVLKNIDFIFE